VRVIDQPIGRIGHPDFVAGDFVDDHEMLAFPMGNAGQRGFISQALEGKPHRQGTEAKPLCRLRNSEKINPGAADLAKIANCGLGKVPPVMRADHAQGCGAAIHRIELSMKWKTGFHERVAACNISPEVVQMARATATCESEVKYKKQESPYELS